MRRLVLPSLISTVLLICAVLTPASADVPPWNHAAITSSGNTVVFSGAVVLGAIINASTAAQPTGECDIYDNTTNSGTIFFAENSIGPGQVITFGESGSGVQFTNGLTVNCALAPTGSLQILWHKV